MKKEKKALNKQIILLAVLLAILVFLLYHFVCFSFKLDFPNFLDKKHFFKNLQDEYYLSSFLDITSIEKQKIEAHKLLQNYVSKLKNNLNQLEILEKEHKEYIKTENKIKSILNDFIYFFRDFSGGSNKVAVLYNEKVRDIVYEKLADDSKQFIVNYRKVKNLLIRRRDFLEKRIKYLTKYINELNNNSNAFDGSITSSRSIVKLPATTLYAANEFDNRKFKLGKVEANIFDDLPLDGNEHDHSNKIEKILTALHKYTKESEEILNFVSMGKINKENVKRLFKNGKRFEKSGNYEAALDNYRNILIFNLSPYDRDVVLRKIEELNRKIVIDRIVRNENKAASSLKVEADQYRKLDEVDKAKELYIKIIKEYPNSSYVDEAIEGLLDCQRVVE